MKKRIILFAAYCIVALNLYAQLTTEEQPYSWNTKTTVKLQKINSVVLIAPDKIRIEKEDLKNDQRPSPIRYAYPIRVNYTLENSGVWQQLDDGSKIWRLKINIPGALSTNTYYDKFWLPKGCKFFVYSEDTKQSIGAITNDFIGGSQNEPIKFATALIYGEDVIYEYYQPTSVKDTPVIFISRIDYGYRHIDNPYGNTSRNFGNANPCNININCPAGNNWQAEKHAVARVSVVSPNGSSWCSCALINNTKNDLTPYVLTANHCLNGLDAIDNNNASQWTFYWEYEHSGCVNSSTEPTHRSTVGATLVANNSVSDFALLLLNATQDIRKATGITPYYLGWDRSGNAGTSGVGIHHPQGDVKKISQTNQIQNHSAQINWSGGAISLPNTLWDATFFNGFIEGGSSGSPLINNSRRVIGQLYGGSLASCDTSYVKRYGKFSVSWTGSNTNTPATDNRRKLQPWLDPNNTTTVLNGISCPTITNFINQPPVITDTIIANCGDINVQNVQVQNGGKLTFDAAGTTKINSGFKVELGSQLKIK